MSTYEVGVWITKELYDYCESQYGDGYRARDRAITWIEGAFDQGSHSVNSVYGSETPNPPTEDITGTRCGSCICEWNNDCCWDNQYDWWVDYYQGSCTGLKSANDAATLLTKGNGGGYGTGSFAVAGNGVGIASLDNTYQEFGYYDQHQDMGVVLEEVGHALIDSYSLSDGDGDGVIDHDSGRTLWDSANSEHCITPMGMNGDQNNCNTNEFDKSKSDGWALFWSGCAEDHFK